MNTFIPGKTYTTRSVCDYDCIFTFKCIKRTAKTVTFESIMRNKPIRVKLRTESDGSEWVLPLGSYSMAPVLHA